ncbi:MAG: nucleotide exchange factor GrpE [Simkaniaceae bacterium]|nr:nucleotide exchange factor GrpE [Simkaniaceae bacterium]
MSKKEKAEKPIEEEKIEVIDPELVDLEQELKSHQDKYLRLLAENENTRKRMSKEKTDMTKFAVQNVISEFVGPLDNFEKALGFAENMSEEVKNWAMGFEMILGQFKDILGGHNVHPFKSVGEKFDPHRHEAVEVEERDDVDEGIILEEFLQGYLAGDRVLRAARVKVSKVKKEKIEEMENEPETK